MEGKLCGAYEKTTVPNINVSRSSSPTDVEVLRPYPRDAHFLRLEVFVIQEVTVAGGAESTYSPAVWSSHLTIAVVTRRKILTPSLMTT